MNNKKVVKNSKNSSKSKSRVVSINISLKTLDRLDTLAEELGISRSSCIAYCVNSFYSGYGLVRSSGFKPSKAEIEKYAQ
jgi:hypothetical protein